MNLALFSKVLASRPLVEATRIAADLGYDGLEPMGHAPHLAGDTPLADAADLRTLLDDHGLTAPCVTTYTGGYVDGSDDECETELAALDPFLDLADVLDVAFVRHAPDGPPVHEATDADFERAAAWMRRAADRAAEHGVTLCVELHAHKVTETVESTLDLLNRIDRENVAVIHDAGNLAIVGEGFGRASVERLGDRLAHVHVKDIARVPLDADLPKGSTFELDTRRGRERFQHRRLGEGNVDHAPLVEALADTGYDGALTVEHPPQAWTDEDPVEVARGELAELRRLVDTV